MSEDVREVVLALRSSVRGAIGGVVGEGSQRNQLQSAFGLDRKLAWQMVRLLEDADPVLAARFYPGAAGFRRFAARMRGAGVDEEVVSAAEAAAVRLETVIERHCGDRSTFDRLLSGMDPGARDEEDLAQRKAMYESSGFVYGVQARTQLSALFLVPSARDGWVDVATVRGFVGLRWLREQAAWPLLSRRWDKDDRSANEQAWFERIEDGDGPPLMRSFCEPSDVDVEAVDIDGRVTEYRLLAGGVGNAHAVRCVLGEITRAAGPIYASEIDKEASLSVSVRTPTERVVFDHFVHDSLAGLGAPELRMCTEMHRLTRGAGARYQEFDTMRALAEVRTLGRGVPAAYERDLPWYGELVERVTEHLGFDADSFVCHRAVLPYPPLSTTTMLTYQLLERGT